MFIFWFEGTKSVCLIFCTFPPPTSFKYKWEAEQQQRQETDGHLMDFKIISFSWRYAKNASMALRIWWPFQWRKAGTGRNLCTYAFYVFQIWASKLFFISSVESVFFKEQSRFKFRSLSDLKQWFSTDGSWTFFTPKHKWSFYYSN